MTDHQKPHPPSGGPRHYGEPPLDSTSLLDDPGLTQTLDRPVGLDATTPIWVRFGPGVPGASALFAASVLTQDPGTPAWPEDSAGRRGSRRVRRPAVSFVSLLTVAAGVAWLARLLHRLP